MSTAPTVAFTERGPALFVTTSTDTHHSNQEFRHSTGAQWPSYLVVRHRRRV
jgi:hypothetical protein